MDNDEKMLEEEYKVLHTIKCPVKSFLHFTIFLKRIIHKNKISKLIQMNEFRPRSFPLVIKNIFRDAFTFSMTFEMFSMICELVPNCTTIYNKNIITKVLYSSKYYILDNLFVFLEKLLPFIYEENKKSQKFHYSDDELHVDLYNATKSSLMISHKKTKLLLFKQPFLKTIQESKTENVVEDIVVDVIGSSNITDQDTIELLNKRLEDINFYAIYIKYNSFNCITELLRISKFKDDVELYKIIEFIVTKFPQLNE